MAVARSYRSLLDSFEHEEDHEEKDLNLKKKALDAAANMSRFSGSAAREAQDELDRTWQQLSKKPDNSPRGLILRAEAEADAEKGASVMFRAEPPAVTPSEEAVVQDPKGLVAMACGIAGGDVSAESLWTGHFQRVDLVL
eukprot:Skav208478  [mRNA]  locus=scaffold1104:373555:391651:- [translate_table: standard]